MSHVVFLVEIETYSKLTLGTKHGPLEIEVSLSSIWNDPNREIGCTRLGPVGTVLSRGATKAHLPLASQWSAPGRVICAPHFLKHTKGVSICVHKRTAVGVCVICHWQPTVTTDRQHLAQPAGQHLSTVLLLLLSSSQSVEI